MCVNCINMHQLDSLTAWSRGHASASRFGLAFRTYESCEGGKGGSWRNAAYFPFNVTVTRAFLPLFLMYQSHLRPGSSSRHHTMKCTSVRNRDSHTFLLNWGLEEEKLYNL